MKGVQHFSRWGKLAPRYIGPFLMSSIHDVFHVSMLKKHLRNEEEKRVLDAPEVEIHDDLTMIEILVCILTKEKNKLRNKMIHLVKVQWNRRGTEETSWEHEEDMRRDFPHLFEQVDQRFGEPRDDGVLA
ncbi:uncharacterized protein LOC109823374 [Asparagus officinalis]|uniref:uncharacterized protein LOC109823374 n=1 Tax=Asparagus officinalis TaxID=4686 RepID=UPI00098E29DD|nr:uncharacterized protein LOC109823374 [Asparagus officinalis]